MAQTIDKPKSLFPRLFWPSVRKIVIDWKNFWNWRLKNENIPKKNIIQFTKPECAYQVCHDGHRALRPGLRSYYLEEPT